MDSTNFPGYYELQFADALFATNAAALFVSIRISTTIYAQVAIPLYDDTFARLGAPAGASHAADTAAIAAKTSQLNFTGTDVKATLDGETVALTTPAPTVAQIRTELEGVGTKLTNADSVATKLSGAMQLDGAVYQFTQNALEKAPGGSTGVTADVNVVSIAGSATVVSFLKKWLRGMFRGGR